MTVPDVLHVLEGGHRQILLHLDKLMTVVSRLQAAILDDETRSQARQLMCFFSGPAREHGYDEERQVFPTLLNSDDVDMKRSVESLLEDHAWIELCWLDIEPQLAGAAAGLPVHDIAGLHSAVQAFVTVLRDHIALEESMAYPELRSRLGVASADVP